MQRELGVTSVVVTHDIQSMRRIADHVGMLKDGTMCFLGTLQDALRQEECKELADFIEGRCEDVPETQG